MATRKLVVVDDEKDLAGFVGDVAEQAGFTTTLYHRADEFKNNYNGDVDVIVLDLLLPDVDGVEVIRFLAECDCKSRLILVSGFDEGVLHSAQKLVVEQGLNFVGSLNKPFRKNELQSLLENIFAQPVENDSSNDGYITSEEDLHSALQNNEFIIHYQPKIHLLSKKIVGLEALVRWEHPEYGLLLPNMFIPVAEKSGQIDDITWNVLEQVVEQCVRLNHRRQKLTISVNVSASTMKDLAIPERVATLLYKHRIDPKQIIFEMTESALMHELTRSLDILTRLRMKGFKLSIDDFGTGYSSLVQLHRAPFAELKIDKSFVSDMENDKEAFAIVETVIVLAQKLDMQVVAEGVESQAVIDLLTGMGCDMAQGFYISRPKPAEEIIEWLKDQPVRTRT